MAYQVWSVVYGETPSASKWNILGTNDASFNDLTGLTAGAAWTAWTPTLSGRFTDGDWTKTCKYIKIGRLVICKISLISADATPMGGGTADAIFTLPVTAAALSLTSNIQVLGTINLFDANGYIYSALVLLASTTTGMIRSQAAGGTALFQLSIDSIVPFTWTTSDEIGGIFIYESAS